MQSALPFPLAHLKGITQRTVQRIRWNTATPAQGNDELVQEITLLKRGYTF